jgi:hypothetical protein
MIHYTCDRCKRVIDPAHDARHVVTVQLETVLDAAEDHETDADRDYLDELDDALQSADLDEDFLLDCISGSLRFDLCSDCYRKYLSDPLGAESQLHVGFSHN